MVSTQALVCTVDVWFAISDASCAIHDSAFWAPDENWRRFVARVRALERSGDLIKQEVVMDGCFLVRVVVMSADTKTVVSEPVTEPRLLRIPTGRVVIRSGGPEREPALVLAIERGVYEARIEWFVDEESKHYDLQTAYEYPDGDGPDGIVTLRRISSDVATDVQTGS